MPRKTPSDTEMRAFLRDFGRSPLSRPIKHRPLKLVRVEEDVWQFDWGDPIREAEDMMNLGCDSLDEGNYKEAVREIVDKGPWGNEEKGGKTEEGKAAE